MDREGHENDRAFYCEAWNGTGSYTYDRIGRGTVRIAAACISILGGMQPGPLHAYLREVFGTGASDDGLIQRHQLLVYPDINPAWRNVDRWPDTEAKTRAFAIFQQLAHCDVRELGARADQDGGPPYFRFSPEAQAQFDAWRDQLEPALRDPGEHPVVVSHLAKYRSLMPTLALLVHLIDCVARGTGGPVSALATTRAVAWCAYLEAHARRVYGSLTAGASLAAGQLAAKISRGGIVPSPFVASWVRQRGWTGLSTPDEVRAALVVLEEYGWVRRVERRSTVKGGRPTVDHFVNPKAVTGAVG